jgi:hypothetical protein
VCVCVDVCCGRHVEEIQALKQRFSREKVLADENYDRSRRMNVDNIMEQTASLKEGEKETLADLMGKQQREINGVIAIHRGELEKLRTELSGDFEAWKEHVREQVGWAGLSWCVALV